MREKNLKRGTFLNFLYITIQRLLQKQEHMIKSFSFLLRKQELFLQKRNSWQVCTFRFYLIDFQLYKDSKFGIFTVKSPIALPTESYLKKMLLREQKPPIFRKTIRVNICFTRIFNNFRFSK